MNHSKWIGRYRIDEITGIGAAGVVSLARDPLIDRNLTVKMLRRDLGQWSAYELRLPFCAKPEPPFPQRSLQLTCGSASGHHGMGCRAMVVREWS